MNLNSQSDTQLAGVSPPANDAQVPHVPPATLGKIAHNELTYRGVDWLLNSTIGVTMTYWTARTESGQKLFQKPVTSFFTKLLTPIIKKPEKIAEGARWGSMFTSIIVGGAAIIPPMVALEKKENKKAIIKWFDALFYGKKKVAEDPEFEQAYAAIDNEPKKDFSTGMAARFTVLVPMLAATIHPDVNKQMLKYLYTPIANASKAAAKSLGIQPKKLMQQGIVEIADGDLSKAPQFVSDWDFIHRTIGLDFGLTAIYAVAHELTYKAMAVIKHEHTHKKLAANIQNAGVEISSSTETGQTENRLLTPQDFASPEPHITLDSMTKATPPKLQMEVA